MRKDVGKKDETRRNVLDKNKELFNKIKELLLSKFNLFGAIRIALCYFLFQG